MSRDLEIFIGLQTDCIIGLMVGKTQSLLAFATGMLLLAAMLLSGCTVLTAEDNHSRVEDYRTAASLAHENHDPISIHSDSEFAAMAVSEDWSGNGSRTTPYFIVGYRIDSDNCISIQGVDSFFVIRDCYLYPTSAGIGVSLHLAPHGCIEACRVYYAWKAIEVSNSSGARVVNNTIYDSNRGVVLTDSSGCRVTGNSFQNCGLWINAGRLENWLHDVSANDINGVELGYFRELSGEHVNASSYGQVILAGCHSVVVLGNLSAISSIQLGVTVSYSQDCAIWHCESVGNYYGMYICHSNGTSVVDCAMIFNSYGLLLDQSSFCNVVSCEFLGNTIRGILAVDSPSCTLVVNTVSDSSSGIVIQRSSAIGMFNNSLISNRMGAELYLSVSSVISGNTFQDNSGTGLELGDGCHSCWVYHNQFIDNDQQAWDDGDNNTWDDGSSLGNYWDDCYGSVVYNISGAAGSFDRYPYGPNQTTTDIYTPPTTSGTTSVPNSTTTTEPLSNGSLWPLGLLPTIITFGSLSVIGTTLYAFFRSRDSSTRQ